MRQASWLGSTFRFSKWICWHDDELVHSSTRIQLDSKFSSECCKEFEKSGVSWYLWYDTMLDYLSSMFYHMRFNCCLKSEQIIQLFTFQILNILLICKIAIKVNVWIVRLLVPKGTFRPDLHSIRLPIRLSFLNWYYQHQIVRYSNTGIMISIKIQTEWIIILCRWALYSQMER